MKKEGGKVVEVLLLLLGNVEFGFKPIETF